MSKALHYVVGFGGQHRRELLMLLWVTVVIMGGKDTSCDYPSD